MVTLYFLQNCLETCRRERGRIEREWKMTEEIQRLGRTERVVTVTVDREKQDKEKVSTRTRFMNETITHSHAQTHIQQVKSILDTNMLFM